MFKKRHKALLNDAELIALAKHDHRHFGGLYERYFETIFRFVFKRLGGDEASSGDITQQTFLKAMAHLSKYEERGLPFSSWLYRIAQNEVNLFFRESKKQTTVELEDRQVHSILQETIPGSCVTVEDQEKLIEQLNKLPQESADLIELRFFQELSFKEIAEIYAITEANAKMKIYRILEKMNKNWTSKQ